MYTKLFFYLALAANLGLSISGCTPPPIPAIEEPEELEACRIINMLPESNGPNYPVFIYGEKLYEVDEVVIGEITLKSEEFTYSEACKCLGLNIPAAVSLGEVSIQTRANGKNSEPCSYTVNSNLPAITEGSSPVILPTPPPGVSLTGIENPWTLAFGPNDIPAVDIFERETFDLSNPSGFENYDPDNLPEILDFPDALGNIIGFYSTKGDTVEIEINGVRYFGKQDGKYNADPTAEYNGLNDWFIQYQGTIPRLILTPYTSGKQAELLYVDVNESIEVQSDGDFYVLKLQGRYFNPGRDYSSWSFYVDEDEFSGTSYTVISERELDIRISKATLDVSPGTHNFKFFDHNKIPIDFP